jgi:hypothetical protein
MRRGLTLIEILIGIFVLSLALMAVGAVFIAETNRMKTNTDEVLGRSARRSGEVLYGNTNRGVYPLSEGWNVEHVFVTDTDIRIVAITYSMENSPPISVVLALKSPRGMEPEVLVMLHENYVPVDGDTIISWYGTVHVVQGGVLSLQDFEKEQPIVLIPRRSTDVLDHHRMPR